MGWKPFFLTKRLSYYRSEESYPSHHLKHIFKDILEKQHRTQEKNPQCKKRRKSTSYYQKNYTKTNSFFIIREARGQGNFIFNVLKENNCQAKFLYPVKVSFQNECEIKTYSDKNENKTKAPKEFVIDRLYKGTSKGCRR